MRRIRQFALESEEEEVPGPGVWAGPARGTDNSDHDIEEEEGEAEEEEEREEEDGEDGNASDASHSSEGHPPPHPPPLGFTAEVTATTMALLEALGEEGDDSEHF